MKNWPFLLLAGLLSPAFASQGTISDSTNSKPAVCATDEFRQFDFWLGHWTVITSEGKAAGTSEISRAADSCAIREQWKSVSGETGMSINYYDAADHQWHQVWVGSDGMILHLEGNFAGHEMILSGKTTSGKETLLHRITWTPLPERKLKQEWIISRDNGRTWKAEFTGIYQPR